jgi:hypothetical protein
MKDTTVKCVGVSYNLSVPETSEEYDQIAGKIGACVESANKNVIYRQSNAQFRAFYCDAVEEDTGIERQTKVVATKTHTDEDGNETTEDVLGYAETEKKYLDRVYAELELDDEAAVMARFGGLVEQAQGEVVFDPSEREPAAKTKKPRKAFLRVGEAIEAKGGQEGLDHVAGKLADELDIEVEATVEGVALALQIKDSQRDLASELLA